MDEGLDTGPILSIGKIGLKGKETAGQMHDKLARLGSRLLAKTIYKYLEGTLEAKEQVGESKYVKTLKREDGRIDWGQKAEQIEKQVRAFSPWPGTFTSFNDKTLKILRVNNKLSKAKNFQIGEVLAREKGVVVQTGFGGLIIEEYL